MKQSFKRILSVTLAGIMTASVIPMALVSASATKANDVVSADNSPQWEQKSDGKVYFYANPDYWKNFKDACVYLYDRDVDEGEMIIWGSKKGRMTNEGDNIWSFDVTGKGYTLDENHNYGIIVSGDWMLQASDLIIAPECLGDMIYLTDSRSENPVDSNKSVYDAAWVNMDSRTYGKPLTITSLGNVVGEALWKGESRYSLFVDFLKNEGRGGVYFATMFNGKTTEQTAQNTAKALGLTEEEYDKAVAESGVDFDADVNPYPYPDQSPADKVCTVLMNQYYTDTLASVDEIAALLEEYGVTPDEADEALFYYNDYKAYKAISELLSVIPGNSHPKGDMNGDGQVDVGDATLIQLFVAGNKEMLYPKY